MKTYEITIKPISGFGTPLKGDTLFGHICWQVAYDRNLLGKDLNTLLADYSTNPFVVISSAYPKLDNTYALKRPDLPLDMLFNLNANKKAEIIAKRKEIKGRRWILVNNNSKLQSIKSDSLYLHDDQLFSKMPICKDTETNRQLRKKGIKSFVTEYTQPHNTINRLTGTTGEGQYAPYSVDQKVFIKDAKLVIFAGIRDDINMDGFIKALRLIGASGYGKDASTGLGKFDVVNFNEINLKSIGADNPNACYTLSPCVPEKDAFDKMYFSPFTRFGRHGDVLAKSGKPFKNPVIMADEGAVLVVKDIRVFSKPYIGTAVTDISKAEPNAVTQGYSLYIPLKVEVGNE